MSKKYTQVFYIILAIASFAAGALLMHFYPKPLIGITPFFTTSPTSMIGLILVIIGLMPKFSKYKNILVIIGLILLLYPLLVSLLAPFIGK
jgi:hypothetical protein